MSRKNVLIAVAVVLVGAAVVAANFYFKRDKGLTVTTEVVKMRDLEAIVSASGKIQPKRLVNISAETPGRVVDLAVNEGDRIKKGQFLLQIDPKSLRSRVDGNAASLESAEGVAAAASPVGRNGAGAGRTGAAEPHAAAQPLVAAADDARGAREGGKRPASRRSRRCRSARNRSARSRAASRRSAPTLESARYDLTKVRMESPIDGIVTRRNIQQGETAVIGTMNNAGTVLLQLADMSVIQAEVEVDETNIPHVQLDQRAKITIDAIPDRTFKGHVTEIGNSPIQAAPGTTTTTQATNFKVVVVLDEPVPEVRPGFTATADITTATSARKSSRCRFRRWRCASWSTTRTARS